MTPLLFLIISVAGGVGAALRFVLDGLLRSRLPRGFPWSTVVINVSGSFLLGFVTALTLGQLMPSPVALVIGTGVMGGYTTFSTSSVETVRLLGGRRVVPALVNALGTVVLAVLAAGAGLVLGSAL